MEFMLSVYVIVSVGTLLYTMESPNFSWTDSLVIMLFWPMLVGGIIAERFDR